MTYGSLSIKQVDAINNKKASIEIAEIVKGFYPVYKKSNDADNWVAGGDIGEIKDSSVVKYYPARLPYIRMHFKGQYGTTGVIDSSTVSTTNPTTWAKLNYLQSGFEESNITDVTSEYWASASFYGQKYLCAVSEPFLRQGDFPYDNSGTPATGTVEEMEVDFRTDEQLLIRFSGIAGSAEGLMLNRGDNDGTVFQDGDPAGLNERSHRIYLKSVNGLSDTYVTSYAHGDHEGITRVYEAKDLNGVVMGHYKTRVIIFQFSHSNNKMVMAEQVPLIDVSEVDPAWSLPTNYVAEAIGGIVVLKQFLPDISAASSSTNPVFTKL